MFPDVPDLTQKRSKKDILISSEYENLFFVALYVPFISDDTPLIYESELSSKSSLFSNISLEKPPLASRGLRKSSLASDGSRVIHSPFQAEKGTLRALSSLNEIRSHRAQSPGLRNPPRI